MSSFQIQGDFGTPLERAAANGHIEIVALLLQVEGIDVNQWVSIHDTYPYHFASLPYYY